MHPAFVILDQTQICVNERQGKVEHLYMMLAQFIRLPQEPCALETEATSQPSCLHAFESHTV